MNRTTANTRQTGFTLVELLIVAIILAILAAIVVPQFASTTTDAQESALRSNLAAIRSAMSLYRQQHGEYPALNAATGGTCSGTAGTGAVDTRQAIVDQLTRYTNANGQSCTRQDGTSFPFGPYLDGDDLPANPVTGDTAIVVVIDTDPAAGDLGMQGNAAGAGWRFDTTSGKFIANDTGLDSQGVRYDAY